MKKIVRRGFTLPEILVTVTVIAVLAAVVVPAVTQYVNKGDAPASGSDIDQVRNAITGYIADTRHYPSNFSDLITAPANETNWKGPYFASQLSGVSGVSATFLSNGSNITLGPALIQDAASHFLTTNVVFGAAATCTDLNNLDKLVDGTSPADSANGNLTWTPACDVTHLPSTLAVTLKLTSIGS